MLDQGIVDKVAREIGRAMASTCRAFSSGRVEQEPAFTDRMLGSIESMVDGLDTKNLTWRAKTLTDRGRNAQEKKYGADFMGVLDIDVPGIQVKKGFLAQSKMWRLNGRIDLNELKEQCVKMLHLSSASYVFIYEKNSVKVLPAIEVLGMPELDLSYCHSARRFFEEHLKCYIGDHAIQSATPETLRALESLHPIKDEYDARDLMYIQARLKDF